MSIENDGRFTWYEDRIYDGIRQDVSENARRYRLLRNVSLVNRGAIVKDKGVRQLVSSALSGGDTYSGRDVRYSGGTQKLMVFHDNGSNGTVQTLVPGTRSWTQERTDLAQVKPWTGMFANKLMVLDGVTMRARDASSTWTTPGNSTVNPSKFGLVYANRFIVFGDPANPYYFYPSGVRDATDWDASLAVKVTDANGEELVGAGICGPFLLVGGDNFLRSYYLGTASPRDWDWDHVSQQIGPVNWQSFVPVTRYKGSGASSYTFFWTHYGPAMCVHTGQGIPTLVPLWEPLRRAMLGESFQGMEGLELSRFSNVEGVWCPEYNEVRFTVSWSGATQNHAILACDLDSAVAFAQGQGSPLWRIKDNSNWDYPVSTLFPVEVDADGLPTTTGKVRTFCAQDGSVYEMDAVSTCKDLDIHPIKLQARKDGYDGYEDGVREHEKSVRGVHVRTSQEGSYDLQVRIVADGGQDRSEDSIDLSASITLWGSGNTWGDGQLWNDGEFVTEEADLHCLGQKFDLEFYDDGVIEAPIEINSWSLWGYVEDRR